MVWLDEALIFLAAAALVVPLTKRLGFGSLLGYLAAGVVIGPAGLGAIGDVDGVLHFAEIGVVFLLFVIGLELHPSRLWVMRRLVFGFGSLQVVVTGAVLALAAGQLGFGMRAALAVGFGLALSSTAFVLQMLAERKELGRPHGRAAFGILLLQDIAIVPLIAALPVLAGAELAAAAGGPSAWLELGRDALVLVLFIVGGRYFLRPILRLVAQADVQEIFTAAALLLVLGSALLMESLGLSMGLGAFLAGVLVADSEYRHQLEVDIQPFKGLLLGLFFMAVGMSTDLGLLADAPFEILGAVTGLVVLKAAVLYGLARAFGLPGRNALTLGLVLAQGGEFGFVLFSLAGDGGLLGEAVVAELNLVVTLSMAATPLLYLLGRRLDGAEPPRAFDTIEEANPPVVIAGFGRFGQIIARILNLSGIQFTALEINPNLVDFVKRYGNKIYYGDARRLDLLRSAGVGRARVFVLAVDDVEASTKIAETVARHFPKVALYARARDRQHAMKLRSLGARGIIRDTLESSVSLATGVLKGLGFSDTQAERASSLFAEHDAQLLDRQYAFHEDEEALIQSTRESAAELKQLFESDASSSKEYSTDQQT